MLDKIIKFISKNYNDRFALIVIFIAAVIVIIPLPLMGIPNGTDLTQHLQFASTYQDAVFSGDFFPGWAATDNQGLGSVGIRFYPPLAYYLFGISHYFIGNWWDGFWINALFWMFLSGIGIYLWAREWLSPTEATFVALVYAFFPYHRFQIYHLIIFAEFAAAAILPFCFLTLTRVIRRGKPVDVILFGISFALLILTHIPTTIIGAIGLGVYALVLMDWKNYKKIFANLFIGGGLSLLASSFHWLRVVTEMNWVKHSSSNYHTIDFYDYTKHLFPMTLKLKELMPPLDQTIILAMLCLLLLVSSLLMTFKVKWQDSGDKRIAFALIISGAVCIFLTTIPSQFIWDNVLIIQKIQFPWRFLSAASVIASLGIIFGISKTIKTFQDLKKPLIFLPILVFMPIFLYFFVQTITPVITYTREDFTVAIQDLKEKRGCECWLPTWAESGAFNEKEKVFSEGRNVTINKWESESREFQIAPGAGQNVRVATFYYPNWKVTVNNQPVEVSPTETGLITFSAPSEESQVKLYFEEPLILKLSIYLSGLTWMFFLAFLSFNSFRRQPIEILVTD